MEWKKGIGIMLRCIAFVLVFSMFFSHTTNLLMRHDDESNEIHAFYGEPEDSIDVLYIGSSPLLRGVSPMVMWKEYGFTGYVRASALQAPAVSYGLLAESLRKQSPEVVVLLCDNIFLEYDYTEREGDLRRGLDGMKMSLYKLDIIREVTEADERQSALSYVFPLMRYHERWKEIDLAEDKPEPLLGITRVWIIQRALCSRQDSLHLLSMRMHRRILKNPSRSAGKKTFRWFCCICLKWRGVLRKVWLWSSLRRITVWFIWIWTGKKTGHSWALCRRRIIMTKGI